MSRDSTNDLFQTIVAQEEKALDFGFYWESVDQLLEQIRSECCEVKDAWLKQDPAHLKEEVGDLINAAISLAIFLKLDPRESLAGSVQKFQKRYDCLVEFVKKDGLENLRTQKMKVLLEYWDRAKVAVEFT